MKFATLKNGRPVAIDDDGMVPLKELEFNGSMLEFIQADKSIQDILEKEFKKANKKSLDDVEFDAPYRNPSKIIAIGLNYVDHASESKMELPKNPLVFTKFPSSIISATDTILIPEKLTDEVDFEVELGVIIGKRAKNVSKEDALSHVFGYTVLNDISARDLQFEDKQWVRAKSLDTFCPLGPVIVTADEIEDPQNLHLTCSVNDKTLQDDNTKNMIFGVADLISQVSTYFTLEPGDLIASGTPSGVGFSRKPPIFIKPGDTVTTKIEGIGTLVNPVDKI